MKLAVQLSMIALLAIAPTYPAVALAHQQLNRFPDEFQFGSASSSYQVECGWNVDGKGENIWDRLTHSRPDMITEGHTGDVAADSYHKYKEDVQLLKNASMDFYRFSISWSRILPNGDNTTQPNEAGLRYYDNLIDELLANGIEPMVTIFHFDLPQPLQDQGGMLNPQIVSQLTHFAEILFERYGDRVRTWYTFNEPKIFCEFVYGSMNLGLEAYWENGDNYRCAYHVLLANAHIYDLYQRKYKLPGARMGIPYNCAFAWPKDKSNASHVEAAERAMHFDCGIYIHPIFSRDGGFPPVVIENVDRRSRNEGRTRSRLPVMSVAEKRFIRGKSDFVSIIYYSSRYVEPAFDAKPSMPNDREVVGSVDTNWTTAAAGMKSAPEGLRAVLNWVRREYNSPEMEINENGWPDEGELNDQGRIDYLRSHLKATLDAISDGCKVLGHTTWSLMDNFEWFKGYTIRFGIYHVDFDVPERTRTAKASVEFLKKVIETRMIPN